jgi:hypothetical protein
MSTKVSKNTIQVVIRRTIRYNQSVFGVWRSWLARRVWDAEVGGSSPLTPTTLTFYYDYAKIYNLTTP